MLFLFRPRQINENATRHQVEVAKIFEKGKAPAAVRIEVEAWGEQGKEANYTRKEGGGGGWREIMTK